MDAKRSLSKASHDNLNHEVFGQINHHKTGAPFLGRPFVLLDHHLNAAVDLGSKAYSIE